MLAITPLLLSMLLPSASALELRSDAWLIGGSVQLTVLDATPGATVRVVRSTTSPGSAPGACPPALGGACLDLASPTLIATLQADAQGGATVTLSVPAGLPPTDLWLQAVQSSGPVAWSGVLPERLMRTCTNLPTPVRSPADAQGLRDCGRIVGDLHLQGLGTTALDLPWLREVTGTLKLVNLSELQSLSGLARLEEVGSLHLEGLTQLSNLDGLERLTTVDRLTLKRLDGLTGLDGLAGLRQVDRLTLDGLRITTLHGLEGVTSSGFDRLDLLNLDELTSLQALAGIRRIEDLNFQYVEALTTLEGLEDLQDADNVDLQHVHALETLAALGSTFLDPSGSLRLVHLPFVDSLTPLAPVLNRTGSVGELWVYDMEGLTTLDGLQGLQHAGELLIGELPLVTGLTPLSDLTTGGRVTLVGLPLATTLNGLHNLAAVQLLTVAELEGITDLRGLEGLERVGTAEESGWLEITGNPNLVDLRGFSGLREVHGDFDIYENPALERLDGLDGLNLVDDLNVSDNAVLQDISGLAVSSPFIYSAAFTMHPLLCEAHVQAVFATIAHDDLGTRDNLGVCP
jgi:hypothetical protein